MRRPWRVRTGAVGGVSKQAEAGGSAGLELPILQENRLAEPLDPGGIAIATGCSGVCQGAKAGRAAGGTGRRNDSNRRSILIIEGIFASSRFTRTEALGE